MVEMPLVGWYLLRGGQDGDEEHGGAAEGEGMVEEGFGKLPIRTGVLRGLSKWMWMGGYRPKSRWGEGVNETYIGDKV